MEDDIAFLYRMTTDTFYRLVPGDFIQLCRLAGEPVSSRSIDLWNRISLNDVECSRATIHRLLAQAWMQQVGELQATINQLRSVNSGAFVG